VKLSRIRSGERLALFGAVALAVLLCFDWFFLSTPDARLGAHETGLRSLGWPITLILLVTIATALAMVFTTATMRAQGWPIVLTVFTFVLGLLSTLLIAIRLIAQPGLGVDAGNVDVEIEPAAFLGLAAAFAIAMGGWIGELDERTDTPEAHEQTEDVLRVRGAPRPVPPATAAVGSRTRDARGDQPNT
jgi:hypothetical protein